jgi:hypothetical protein
MGDESGDILKLRPVTFTFKKIKPEKLMLDFDHADPHLTDEQKQKVKDAEDRPSMFINDQMDPNAKQYGLIAEEVAKVCPDLVVFDKEDKPLAVKYHDLPALLLNEIQKLVKRIEILESK